MSEVSDERLRELRERINRTAKTRQYLLYADERLDVLSIINDLLHLRAQGRKDGWQTIDIEPPFDTLCIGLCDGRPCVFQRIRAYSEVYYVDQDNVAMQSPDVWQLFPNTPEATTREEVAALATEIEKQHKQFREDT